MLGNFHIPNLLETNCHFNSTVPTHYGPLIPNRQHLVLEFDSRSPVLRSMKYIAKHALRIPDAWIIVLCVVLSILYFKMQKRKEKNCCIKSLQVVCNCKTTSMSTKIAVTGVVTREVGIEMISQHGHRIL